MFDFPFVRLDLTNFRRFEKFSLSPREHNVLVGPNNCGKSSILDAFRILNSCYRFTKTSNPNLLELEGEGVFSGYTVPDSSIPVPLENIARNYSDDDAIVAFHHRNGAKLTIRLNSARPTRAYLDSSVPRTSSTFRRAFPIDLVLVPPLAPLEEQESYIQDETIRRNISTRLSSRYFRNIWFRSTPELFESFQCRVRESWEGMDISRPEAVGIPRTLRMFFSESRRDREVYWSGFGFQVWLQVLTHFARGDRSSCLVFDEPDIYLHPDLQRRLLRMAQASFRQTLLATHSVEIINECEPSDIILINPTLRKARKVATDEEYQALLNYLGSADNIEFSRVARAKKLIFFEGEDKKLLRRLAAKTGATFGHPGDVLVLEAGGFSQWKRVKDVKWTLERVLSAHPDIICLFDKDYRSDTEMTDFESDLRAEGIECRVLKRKELENYIIVVDALVRLVRSKIRQRKDSIPENLETRIKTILEEESDKFQLQVQSQMTAHATRYAKEVRDHRDESTINREVLSSIAEAWPNLERRLQIVPGKELISALSSRFQEAWRISISPVSLANEVGRTELDPELLDILNVLEAFSAGA